MYRSQILFPLLAVGVFLSGPAYLRAQDAEPGELVEVDEPEQPPEAGEPTETADADEADADEADADEADADEADADEAVQALLAEAVSEYDAARYPEALALFRRAHELAPTARTLRGIGMAAFEAAQYVDSLRSLRASLLERERPLTDAQRAHVTRLIERAEVFVATVQLDVTPPEAPVLIDGGAVVYEPDGTVLLDPGHHVVNVVDAAGHSQSLEFDLVGGTHRGLVIRADALGGGGVDPVLVTGLSLLIAGGVAAVAAIATGVIANELYGQLQRDCDGFVCPASELSTRDRAADLALATDVIGAVSAVAMATGVVLTIVSATSSAPPPVALACGPDGCSAVLSGAF